VLFRSARLESRNDPHYTAPFRDSSRADFDPGRNPYFSYGTARCFLARQGDRVVGRCAAFRNPKMDTDEARSGAVGHFECVESDEVAKALLDAAVGWLDEQGSEDIIGPLSFSIWSGYRFRVDAFDRAPFFTENYNKPYYPALFEGYGFAASRNWISNRIDMHDAAALERFAIRTRLYEKRYRKIKENGYEITGSTKRDLDRDFVEIHRIVMAAFATHAGFYLIDLEEFDYHFGGLKRLVKPRNVRIARRAGRVVGFAILCHDIGRALGAMRGSTGLRAKLRFKLNLEKKTLMHIFSAIHPEQIENRSGLAAALMHDMINNIYTAERPRYVLHPTMYERGPAPTFSDGIGERIGTYTLYRLER
jgi:hypothetical protein